MDAWTFCIDPELAELLYLVQGPIPAQLPQTKTEKNFQQRSKSRISNLDFFRKPEPLGQMRPIDSRFGLYPSISCIFST